VIIDVGNLVIDYPQKILIEIDLAKDIVLVLEPFSGVAEQSGDGKDEAFEVHESSFGAIEFDQDCDHATTHGQVQLGIRLWKLSCVEEAVVITIQLMEDSVAGLYVLPTFFELHPVEPFVSRDVETIQDGNASGSAEAVRHV